jgi:hypothetical protein
MSATWGVLVRISVVGVVMVEVRYEQPTVRLGQRMDD